MDTDLPTPISTDGPPVDVPMLRKAVEWAEAEAARPDAECEWYQNRYFISGRAIGRTCGTAYCIAGYAVSLVDGPDVVRDLDHKCWPRAASLLGLTSAESSLDGGLFDGCNSIERVREIAGRIAARAGERL